MKESRAFIDMRVSLVMSVAESHMTLCDPMDCSPPGEFPRQEYWDGLPFSFPRDLPDPGVKLRYPALQADSLPSEPPGKPFLDMKRCKNRDHEINS